jgi:hypothetical protein
MDKEKKMEKRDCGFGQWQLFAISYDEYKRQVAAHDQEAGRKGEK